MPRRSARERILAALSRTVEKYDRRERKYVRVPITQVQLAKELGIHPRTLQRWKNEGREPGRDSARAEKKLSAFAGRARADALRAARRDKKRHRGAAKLPPALTVIPRGERRKLKMRDKRGKEIPNRFLDSEWVNYRVKGWKYRELFQLLAALWKAGRVFQFVYEVPKGQKVSPEDGKRPKPLAQKKTRAATSPINPRAFADEADLAGFLARYIDMEKGPKSREMIYIAVLDQKPKGRK